MRRSDRGFTLAELLIVVAIIAVLVAISIPIFTSQLEKARQTTDLANMRSAYASALAEWMSSSDSGKETTYYYTGSGVAKSSQGITGYGQSSKDVSTFEGVADLPFAASGTPNKNGAPAYLTVRVAADGASSLHWGGGNGAYLAAVTPYQSQTLMDLSAMPNEQRVAADQTTLRAIGEAILDLHLTKAQLNSELGILSDSRGIRIADYYQLKSGSFSDTYQSDGFKLTSKEGLLSLLSDMGYNGGSSTSAANGTKTDTTFTNPLFYSDELSTNKYGSYGISQTMRSIIIENIKTDSNGVITQMTIYSKAMNNQANMSDADKAKFRITLP